MDVEVDELTAKESGMQQRQEDMDGDSDTDDEGKIIRGRQAQVQARDLKKWKGQLQKLMGERFLPSGTSQRFVADGSLQATLSGAASMRMGSSGATSSTRAES